MKPRRVWLVALAIVASAGAIASAQGFMRRMRVRDDPRYFYEFGPNGDAPGINVILYALSH